MPDTPRFKKLSYVLPVRDEQTTIERHALDVLEWLEDLVDAATELLIVDDGSRDATAEVLDRLERTYPQIRVARHPRARGMEAAGQTGLSRSTGELVLIQESAGVARTADARRLLQMAADGSIVAARAESTTPPTHAPLVRRIKTWAGATPAVAAESSSGDAVAPALQMVRRPNLGRLDRRDSGTPKMRCQTIRTSRLERVAVQPASGRMKSRVSHDW